MTKPLESRHPADSTTALPLFLGAFSAADLAEPLASFDDSTSRDVVLRAIRLSRRDIIGVRRSGVIAGWLTLADLEDDRDTPRQIGDESVVESSAPLHAVLVALSESEPLFVRGLGQIVGTITRKEIEKPAMRMWLFGLITVMELRVTAAIRDHFINDEWEALLSDGRREKARWLQSERDRQRESRELLDCLQLADKGTIIAKNADLRDRTRFESRAGIEHFVTKVESLRNHLAHAHELMSDWEVILDLARNLHRIVLGFDPARTTANPTTAI